MKISIVIPTTDKEKYLVENSIRHIEKSTHKDYEIIVVNLGKERSEQRNDGILKATGEYILYLDSDQYVTPDLLEELNFLAEIGYGAVYIPERIITKGFFGYLRNWERQFYTGTAVDCVRFFKKDGCAMFDVSLNGPEDSDHDRRTVGLRTVATNYLLHDDRVTIKSYFRKKIYYSKSMDKFKQKHPNDKVLNFKWRCFVVFFENGKFLEVLKRPDLFICLMVLIFLRGVIYVSTKTR